MRNSRNPLVTVLTERPVALAWTCACAVAGVCAQVAHAITG